MTKDKLQAVLDKHKLWLNDIDGGERADLYSANLNDADLRGADLRGADLYSANLNDADLRNADLRNADLRNADLRGANLRGANLRGADLRGADLHDVNWHLSTAFYPLQCPQTGAYTAYKKARGLIVELEIPADALRSSATSRKCRASKARVISITNTDGTSAGECIKSNYDATFVYRVGETVEVHDFDTDRWNECAPGIHHFITREEAVIYQ